MTADLRLALFQPDMAANTGAMMRLCACLGLALDIIEPCGFVFDDRKWRRAAMDYAEHIHLMRHASWAQFDAQRAPRRLVLLTTKADRPYYRFRFQPSDILMVGRESAGVPEDVHEAADARILVPMKPGRRSLNVGLAAAICAAEAVRQTEDPHEGT